MRQAVLFLVEAAFGIAVAEVAWGKAGDFLEGVGEVVRVRVADIIANLGDGVVGLAKLRFGMLHFGLQNKLFDRNLRPFFKIGGQVLLIVAKIICNIRNLQVAADI